MPTPRKLSVLVVGGLLSLLVLSVAKCRLDMLIKPGAQLRPVLSVAPAEVRDSARAGSDDVRRVSIEIKNTGDGSFNWSATKDKGWIGVTPTDGHAPGTLTISLDAHGLAPATYQGVVTVHAPGTEDSLATINVTFKVQRAGLIVLPGSVQHGTNVNSGEVFHDDLQISNSGSGVLVWTASKSKPWLALSAVAGTGPGTVSLTIRSAGLAAGTYTDEVVITAPGSEGSPARIPVTLSIFQPGLTILPTAIRDSANLGDIAPRTDTLEVRNTGGGNMTWTVTKSKSFVSLSPTSGTAPRVDSVVVTFNPIGLALGSYKDTVVFRSPEATNSPVKIPVQLDIVRPMLSVKPAAITDGTVPGDTKKRVHALAITNAGRGQLVWTAAADSPWIALSAVAGSVGDTIDVTLDPAGLLAGTHHGSIVVNSPGSLGSPATVNVTLSIASPCSTNPIIPDDAVSSALGAGDCIAPQRPGSRAELYTVFAAPGDTLSFRMTATFNAYLVLTDAAGQVLDQNDECPGEIRTACIRNFAVTAAGQYVVEATTSAPGETGNYTLWVTKELPPPPPQGLGQFRKDGVTPIGIGGTTPDDEAVFKGTVSDPNAADSVRLEVEIEPLGSPFTDVRTHQSLFVAASRGSVIVTVGAGVTNNTAYHWQARSCDRTGRCSAWLKFGGNSESAADFTVSAPPPPPPSPPGGVAPGAKP
jgi:hypothetical protein